MTWYTRCGGEPPASSQGVSPTLLYQKWHAYDGGRQPFETKVSRPLFLEQVAAAANELTGGRQAAVYLEWQGRYLRALRGLGLDERVGLVAATTLWRLVAGFATNPALESGLVLHPLYGFPFLPGSTVRGLVRQVAEMELVSGEREAWRDHRQLPPEADRAAFLDRAEQVQTLFGSLSLEALLLPRPGAPRVRDPNPPWPPRTVLGHWLASEAPPLPRTEASRIRVLLDAQEGGLVAFYDAVPEPGQEKLLELDLLNPHYPGYYDTQGQRPPSDDQNPRPIQFLAVRPGARFVFPFRLRRWPSSPARDEQEAQQVRGLRGLSCEVAAEQLRRWLIAGLTDVGAGAKTASGYGYFTVGAAPQAAATDVSQPGAPTASTIEQRPARGKTLPAVPWEARVRNIGVQNAALEVPRLLGELQGDERRLAARALLESLKENLRQPKHRDKPWAALLREAAGVAPSN